MALGVLPTQALARLPLLACLVLGCDGGDLSLPSEADDDRLVQVEGDDQAGLPGEPLPGELVVRLVDARGAGLPGRTVTWVVSAGGGSIEPASDSTDSQGFARAQWTLGPEEGPNRAEAVVSFVGSVTFTATGSEGEPPARAIEPLEGTEQVAPVGMAVPVPPAVRVTENGVPVAGVEVSFTVAAGGGTVDGATQATNADGIARVGAWVLGSEPGLNRLEATGEGLTGSPVVFTAEGTAGSGVDRLVFRVQPPDEVDQRERFRVEVALVDGEGDLVPLSGIVIYLGLFREGRETPSNNLILGDRFRETDGGIAVFDDLGVIEGGRYRFRALTDDLPEYGQAGPQPYLFSVPFEVD